MSVDDKPRKESQQEKKAKTRQKHKTSVVVIRYFKSRPDTSIAPNQRIRLVMSLRGFTRTKLVCFPRRVWRPLDIRAHGINITTATTSLLDGDA